MRIIRTLSSISESDAPIFESLAMTNESSATTLGTNRRIKEISLVISARLTVKIVGDLGELGEGGLPPSLRLRRARGGLRRSPGR